MTFARSQRGGRQQGASPQRGVPQRGVPQSLLQAVALTKVFRTDAGPVQAVRGVDLCLAPGRRRSGTPW